MSNRSPKRPRDPTSQRMGFSTQDPGLCVIFIFIPWHNFINIRHGRIAANQYVTCGKWVPTMMSSSTSMYDFQTFKSGNKNIKKCLVFLPFSEEIHQKPLALQVLQDALALRDERFSAPSIPSPKICQVKGFLKRLLCCLSLTSLAKRE